MPRPVWAEIDLAAIANNIKEIRRVVTRPTQIMAVVKANAYGHGAVEVSRVALEHGASWLGVAIFEEAEELRQAGIQAPILILGYSPADEAEAIVSLGLSQAVWTRSQAEALSRAAVKLGRPAKIHIKLDTGMGRIGFLPTAEAVKEIERIASLPGIAIEGTFTHFSSADDEDKTFTQEQLQRFHQMLEAIRSRGVEVGLRHAASSAAILTMPETHLDLVRLGVSLYGHFPSPATRRNDVTLLPAMSFKTQIVHLKELPAGWPVSYGRTYYTSKPTLVATLPVGYADGYFRSFSNCGEVIIRGRRCPVIGRVCMDQIMVDATSCPQARVGDEAVLFGRQGKTVLSTEELAERIGTISYELLCAVGRRVPRRYVWAQGECYQISSQL
ncbi:MAG: alanine racemase [Clostridia bacterium]|nr:alanine racemase [Clostridia bacterium]